MARFVADQKTNHRMPHTACCRLLGISEAWYYKWADRARTGAVTAREERRRELDTAVAAAFNAARGKHGSPRLWMDLKDLGWDVSVNTVADSMRRQGLVARPVKRRRCTTRQDKSKKPFPDLIRRDFTAWLSPLAVAPG